jgi:excinuclease ABC subunit A
MTAMSGALVSCRHGTRACTLHPSNVPKPTAAGQRAATSPPAAGRSAGYPGLVRVRGAREHNLKKIDVDIPRDALVVFTGVSGSGKSSLAFGTLYAEAQRRFLESVSPYAHRLFHQLAVPDVDAIEGLPPAIALQQQRGGTTARSSVGSVTTLSNLVRMLYSRAGDYPDGQAMLHAEDSSPNSPRAPVQGVTASGTSTMRPRPRWCRTRG